MQSNVWATGSNEQNHLKPIRECSGAFVYSYFGMFSQNLSFQIFNLLSFRLKRPKIGTSYAIIWALSTESYVICLQMNNEFPWMTIDDAWFSIANLIIIWSFGIWVYFRFFGNKFNIKYLEWLEWQCHSLPWIWLMIHYISANWVLNFARFTTHNSLSQHS